jgi:4-hydroxythreonine-4-phosphate dehydrogenase
MGYPAGIGPQVIVKALADQRIKRLASFLIIGDGFVFNKAISLVKQDIKHKVINSPHQIVFSESNALLYDLNNITQKKFRFGIVSKEYGGSSIEYIEKAIEIIKEKRADLLITAPIHKYAAQLSGFKYPGHTEFLAHLTGAEDYAMMLMGGPLKIILATTHLPLKKISANLKKKDIVDKLILTNRSLKRYFRLSKPKIAVCGLNPHAGEEGSLGDEEIKIISPAIKEAKESGVNSIGPLAADGLFYYLYRGDYDACLCMYHDQGLVALKMIARDASVNVTLGLPFIRTSPCHGTALEIAATPNAHAESMKEAIRAAVLMFRGAAS